MTLLPCPFQRQQALQQLRRLAGGHKQLAVLRFHEALRDRAVEPRQQRVEVAGGVQQADGCALNDQSACHALTALVYPTVDLKPGTGAFSTDAVSETFSVACPPDVAPCAT